MKSASGRPYRRVPQACDNCRRKKIRCPGEKPGCSTCARLRQRCCYATDIGYDQGPGEADGHVADRLAQLEEKLGILMDRVERSPKQEASPFSDSSRRGSTLSSSPAITEPSVASTAIPLPSDTVERALDVYFKHIHRQPLWLFDVDFTLSPDFAEELICAIIALSMSYSISDFTYADLPGPDSYSEAARKLIMLKIANGSVGIQTLQALCLLAFFNLVSGDLPLAGLNTAFAKNLIQYSILDYEPTQIRTPTREEQSRLFWSISFLDVLCGTPTLVPSAAHDIQAPQFLSFDDMTRRTSMLCPLLPQDAYGLQEDNLPGIWAYMFNIGSLWRDVRLYVFRCTEGVTKAPWQPDSDYTPLYSRLLDLEISWPASLRSEKANFADRTPQEVQENRDYWLPWLRIQVTYHALHSVLNHPFVYSFRASEQKLGINTFWAASSELALRHSTWIARLIEMARNKDLELADPFFAQAAAIAGTQHLYWANSTDAGLQASALKSLEICKTLIAEMASGWPLCQSIGEALDQFINLANPCDHKAEDQSAIMAAKVPLMWVILDIAAPQFPSFTGPKSFKASIKQDARAMHDNPKDEEMGSPLQHSSEDVKEGIIGHQSSSPSWSFSRPIYASSPSD
ncbi:hypothetical protein ACJZ2D_004619 [Fusarium nematophilum]